MSDEKHIREELSKILIEDPTNYSKILELSVMFQI